MPAASRLKLPPPCNRSFPSQTCRNLRVRLPGAEEDQSRYPPRRDLRAARAQRRRQDHADRHHLRHSRCRAQGKVTVDGHDIITDYRAARSLIGLVPQELHTDAFESVWATVSFSRGLFNKPKNPAYIEKVLRALSLWDKKDDKIMTLSGGMKRRVLIAKALSPRAADPVPRRADRRRRRRTAQGHVAGGARPARFRRHHHPHHALHRRSRGHGRPHRRHQQRRDHPGRGKGRADAQARQEAADTAAPAEAATRFRPNFRASNSRSARTEARLIYDYDTKAERTGVATLLGELSRAGMRIRDLQTTQSSLEDIFVGLVSDRQ